MSTERDGNANTFIVGAPGVGKSRLLASLLNAADLRATKVFLSGGAEVAALGRKSLDLAAAALVAPRAVEPRGEIEAAADACRYEFYRTGAADAPLLVIVDEADSPSPSLRARIVEDLKAGKITLWLAAQSFGAFERLWDLNTLYEFRDFYFFRSSGDEHYLSAAVRRRLAFSRNSSGVHLASATGTGVERFLSKKLLAHLSLGGAADEKFLMSLKS